MRVLGAVLIGGRSSRFGSDKAAAAWHGRTLADHAAASIAPWVDQVVTVGGQGTVADLPKPGLGPLGGIAGALDHASRHGFDSVLTIACDMPRVPAALLAELVRRAPSCCGDAPVLGHWPAELAGSLVTWLDGDERAVRRWARNIGALPIIAPVPLANINTQADLLTL